MKKHKAPVIYTPEEALVKLQQFCAFRERSEKEVGDKLYKMGVQGAAAQKVIGQLKEQGFINEQRFSNAFAGGKFRTRKWGRVKIKAMLTGAKVGSEAIQAALGQISDSEYRSELEKLMIKKLAGIRDTDRFQRKQKLVRFATGKGYEPELVFELASKMIPED